MVKFNEILLPLSAVTENTATTLDATDMRVLNLELEAYVEDSAKYASEYIDFRASNLGNNQPYALNLMIEAA